MATYDDRNEGGLWETVTHARLRLDQGDVSGAARILAGLLGADPQNTAAQSLLERAHGIDEGERTPEPIEDLAGTEPAAAGQLANRFRAILGSADPAAPSRRDRVGDWGTRVARNRGRRADVR